MRCKSWVLACPKTSPRPLSIGGISKADGETLVIVTADHETGGFAIGSKEGNYNKIEYQFTTENHTGAMVPVFAYGPGSAEFSGIYENTEIYHKIKQLIGF